MPFKIVRNDITKMNTEAIVNTANDHATVGTGCDSAVFDTQEYARFQKDSTIFTVLFIALLILPVPLVILWKWLGLAMYLCLFGIGMYFAVRIEKYKKKYDIQTYKEIVAFTDGKSLDEIEKAREEGKRPYQKALLAAGSAALVVIIALIMTTMMKLFS